MANLGLSYPNRAIGATASGGSWLAALPASNATTRELARVARSTSAASTDTRLRLDLGAARTLRAFALCNHNLTQSAQWRVLLGTTSGGSDVFAGTLANVWQLAAFDATVTALGVDDGQYQRQAYAAILVLPQAYSARHVTFEIVDTSNPQGFVQIGMAWAGGLFTPEVNVEYGAQGDGHEDLSSLTRAEAGAEWPTARRRLRRTRFLLPALTLTEADIVHEMERVVGSIDDVLYIPDTTDPAEQQRYGFVGRMTELSPMEYPQFARRAKGFAILERA